MTSDTLEDVIRTRGSGAKVVPEWSCHPVMPVAKVIPATLDQEAPSRLCCNTGVVAAVIASVVASRFSVDR